MAEGLARASIAQAGDHDSAHCAELEHFLRHSAQTSLQAAVDISARCSVHLQTWGADYHSQVAAPHQQAEHLEYERSIPVLSGYEHSRSSNPYLRQATS